MKSRRRDIHDALRENAAYAWALCHQPSGAGQRLSFCVQLTAFGSQTALLITQGAQALLLSERHHCFEMACPACLI
jgi:hypothetical protein